MNLNKLVLVVFILLISIKVLCQSNRTPEQIVADLLESVAQDSEMTETHNQAFENLLDIINNPISINNTTKEELEQLMFLTPIQVQNLFNYTQTQGNISSIYQLQGVADISIETIKTLQHFLNFEQTSSIYKSKKYLNGQWIVRDMFDFENAKGYNNDSVSNKYLGNKHHLYSRMQLKYGRNWIAGLTVDKDSGEPFLGSHPDYVDFYSAHVMYIGKKWLKSLIIGDYNINIGQGLALWSGTAMGKTTEPLNVIKRGSIISKYTSANESGYFRGAATTLAAFNFELTLFGNYKLRDASIAISGEDANEVLSLPKTGYHRTENEISQKHTLLQKSAGANLNYQFNNLNVGLGGYYNCFETSDIIAKEAYKQLASPITERTNYWLNYKYSYRKLIYFGEIASTSSLNVATTNGFIFSPQNNITLSLLHRYINKKYYSFYTNAFTEYGTPSGERGIYLGIVTYPLKNLELSGYFDLFKNDWIKYQTQAPANGYEFMVNTSYKFNSKFNVYLRYKEKEKAKNTRTDAPLYKVVLANQKKVRIHGTYITTPSSQFQFRIEKSFYGIENSQSQGYLSYIDFKKSLFEDKLVAWFRYTVFNTDDYNTRIYTYENDLLYNFYTPAFQNEGTRFYTQVRWKIKKEFRVWVKYSRTRYSNKTEIGSGMNAILGNTRTNIKIQLQYVF